MLSRRLPGRRTWRHLEKQLKSVGVPITRVHTVVVTHFMVINIAAGVALDDRRLVTFRPDNCSVTVFESAGAGLRLVSRGKELETKVG